MWPKQNECFVVGSEVFLTEKDAADYSKHFNLGAPTKVERAAKQTGPKQETAPKAAAPKTAAPKKSGAKAATPAPGANPAVTEGDNS